MSGVAGDVDEDGTLPPVAPARRLVSATPWSNKCETLRPPLPNYLRRCHYSAPLSLMAYVGCDFAALVFEAELQPNSCLLTCNQFVTKFALDVPCMGSMPFVVEIANGSARYATFYRVPFAWASNAARSRGRC